MMMMRKDSEFCFFLFNKDDEYKDCGFFAKKNDCRKFKEVD